MGFSRWQNCFFNQKKKITKIVRHFSLVEFSRWVKALWWPTVGKLLLYFRWFEAKIDQNSNTQGKLQAISKEFILINSYRSEMFYKVIDICSDSTKVISTNAKTHLQGFATQPIHILLGCQLYISRPFEWNVFFVHFL